MIGLLASAITNKNRKEQAEKGQHKLESKLGSQLRTWSPHERELAQEKARKKLIGT